MATTIQTTGQGNRNAPPAQTGNRANRKTNRHNDDYTTHVIVLGTLVIGGIIGHGIYQQGKQGQRQPSKGLLSGVDHTARRLISDIRHLGVHD